MSKCCDSNNESPLETLPAGLASLPRQLVGFAEIRQRLLERLSNPDDAERSEVLGPWRPSGDDYGLMLLEMWAYVADVLAFYDERIANESYLGTAVRRPSLRRLVELIGYTPRGGIAATSVVAAIADGRVPVVLPPATGFRSRGFNGEPPQVFETAAELQIHPLWNQWKVEPFRRRPTVDSTSFVGDEADEGGKDKSGAGQNRVNVLLFLPREFGLAVDELVVIEARNPGESDFESQPSRVVGSEPFVGKDDKTYTRVSLEPPIVIESEVDLSTLRARRPTQVALATANEPIGSAKETLLPVDNVGDETVVYLDGAPTAFRLSDPIVAAINYSGEEPAYEFVEVTGVKAAAVSVTSIPEDTINNPDPNLNDIVVPSPRVVATELRLSPALPSSFLDPAKLTLHHSFVNGGDPTNVCKRVITADELSDPEGVPIAATVELPLDPVSTTSAAVAQSGTAAGVIEQPFLFVDADETGFLADGQMIVGNDGKATMQVIAREQIGAEQLKLPLTIYGNVVDTTRGESVYGEVLGNGNPRVENQRFKLKKKPLTYLHQASAGADSTTQSTLRIRVDGIEWQPVGNFFGCGPSDPVYIVRHDDDQNTFVIFGDGLRGARLPAGVANVVADYRFGAGAASPPANHIKQLASAVKGLRSVKSPVAALSGKDPDTPEQLRSNAPRTAMLLGRAVSAADFEALVLDSPGIISARANWLWIPAQMQAGIVVHYIGDADETVIRDTLRAQSDPSLPLEVDKAEAIAATVTISVEIDPTYVKETVAEALRLHLAEGVLSPEQATIGGTFWPSSIHRAAAEVAGVIAVNGLGFTTDATTVQLSATDGTCIDDGTYLDFSADGGVSVTAVDAVGLPPAATQKGSE
jgi:hypothetical protein